MSTAVRLRALEAAVLVGGVSLAVLVARDGSPAGRAGRVAVVVIVVGAVVRAQERASPLWRGVTTAITGSLFLAIGAGYLPHLVKDGPHLAGGAALVLTTAGVVALVGGSVAAVRAFDGWGRRGAWILTTVAVAALVALLVGPPVAATNPPHAELGATPTSLGLPHEDVVLRTADGVDLAAWYLPSRNGAAVVLRHGAGSTRSSVLPQAEVLAAQGFGVLLVDARGHGASGGRAMDFGWHGDADIAASVDHLIDRDDVQDDRIAVAGMSMGAEEAIGASAADRRIRAVVAEGATARSAGDEAWLSDAYGWRGALQEQLERAQDVVIRVLSGEDAPMANRDAVRRSGTTRYLLIAAGSVADEQKVAYDLASIAPDRVEVWVVPGAGHTAGLRTDRAAWARRVGDFLGRALELDTSTNPEGRAR